MKKLLNIFSIVLTVPIAFTACSPQDSLSEELVSVSLTSSGTTRSLIADVDFNVSMVTLWKYTATKADKGFTKGQTGVGVDNAEELINGETQLLSQGSWNFVLYGYDTNSNLICQGSADNATVTEKKHSVAIYVQPIKTTGVKGTISISKDIIINGVDGVTTYSTGNGGYTLTAKVYKGKSKFVNNIVKDRTESDDAFSYSVDAGLYNVLIEFTAEAEDGTSYTAASASKLINVFDNLTTNVSGTLEEGLYAAELSGETGVVEASVSGYAYRDSGNNNTQDIELMVSSTPAGDGDNTTVLFPKGSIALGGATVNRTTLTLSVSSSSLETVTAKSYTVTSGGSVVAAIDFTLTGTVADSTDVSTYTNFGSAVQVTTYIEKGLDVTEPLSIEYVGNVVEETEETKPQFISYDPITGKLVFKVYHFSEYVVVTPYTVVYDYATLNNAVQKGANIRLVSDITVTQRISVNRGSAVVEINLNGYKISAGFTPFQIQNGHLKFSGTGTVEDRGATYSSTSLGAVLIQPNNSDDNPPILTVGEGVKLKGWSGITILPYKSYTGYVKAGVVNLNGKIDSSSVGIYINGNINKMDEGYPCTININDGAEINATSAGIYAAGYAIWNIGNAKITSGTVFSLKSGTFTINGGEYKATGEDKTTLSDTVAVDSSNGAVLTGAVLSMTSNKSYANKLDVTVKGGKFTSTNSCAVYEGIPSNLTDTTSYVTLSIENGTFSGSSGKAAVLLNNMKDANKNVIKGGTFNSDPTEYLLSADGYSVTKDETVGTWTVAEIENASST